MFDFSEIFKNLQEMIEVRDGPDNCIEIVSNNPDISGNPDFLLPDADGKESLKQLMQMVGGNDPDVDFEVEGIEGGIRLTFQDEEGRDKIKALLADLFSGDKLQSLLTSLMETFAGNGGEGGLGDLLGKMTDTGDENQE